MRIGIIGAGLMGSALGTIWAQRGHHVLFSYSRDKCKLRVLAQQAGNGAEIGLPTEAAQMDVVLIAVPWRQLDDALQQAGTLNGKIVLSCMLPMNEEDTALAVGFNTSGSEELTQRTGARVIGTFNTVWSDVIRQQGREHHLSMFFVGDDAEAKTVAQTLIRDAGFEPVDAGELRNARLLEPFGLMMGQLGFAYDPLVAYRFLKP
jgi:8-hydroxy-5-deazaflavin:NADPH oxidoreductase